MEEYDPYAQHNEVPEVGYIDPPAEPYRYISPLRRDGVYLKNSSLKKDKPLETVAKTPSVPNVVFSDACVQTTLTGEELDRILSATIATPQLRSASGGASGKRPSVLARRPSEPQRSSSSKKIGSTVVSMSAPRAKSSSKIPLAATEGPVLAAPRSRPGVSASGISLKSASSDTKVASALAPPQSCRSVSSSTMTPHVSDVASTVPRKMFSGSGNNGVAVSRVSSSQKTPQPTHLNVQCSSQSTLSNTSLKRGKSCDRPASLVHPTSGTALQAALARNLLRKQHKDAMKPEGFSAQTSGTGLFAKRAASDHAFSADGSPVRHPNSLAANLPQSLVSPPSLVNPKTIFGSLRSHVSLSPESANIQSTPSTTKFSRGLSTGSNAGHTGQIDRRLPSSSINQSSPVSLVKRTTVSSMVPPPLRTLSSKQAGRLKGSGTPPNVHVDPSTEVSNDLGGLKATQ